MNSAYQRQRENLAIGMASGPKGFVLQRLRYNPRSVGGEGRNCD